MDKPILKVASFSGGKDSTAMLLGMLERGETPDIVLFCDTGLEFPQMYEHIDRVERDIGIHITRVKAEHSFEHYMFDAKISRKQDSPIISRLGYDPPGNSWPDPLCRWCTSKLKDRPRERFFTSLGEKFTIVQYIGIAADEEFRLERKRNKEPNHKHPLVEWGMTEADCLQYCYDRGYDWGGLYEHFKRVSCWCCPLQTLADLRQLYVHFPDLWARLKDWDKRTWRSFRADYSVEQLEVRFAFEEECIKAGRSITDRAFYRDLKKRLIAGGEPR